MNKYKITKRYKKLIQIGLTLITSITLIACTTTQKRDDAIVKSLKKQTKVLQALMDSRREKDVANRIKEDVILAKAEEQFSSAIESVQESNELIAKKLLKQNKKECDCGN